ncbi:MAG: cupin domain-containing protein [Actinobacteria bacterium]|nr:cupin domain-containing protein [Actinomycetota bacterium]
MDAANPAKARKGVKIFRATESVDLHTTDFMDAPTMSDAARAGLGTLVSTGSGDGAVVKVLNRSTPESGGFSLVHCWFKSEFPLPRHSHDVDCMYYVISGEAHMGNQVLRPGDSFFIPADAPYGYTPGPEGVEILEIRKDCDRFDMQIADVPESRWEAMAATSEARRAEWAAARTSPTFAANQD